MTQHRPPPQQLDRNNMVQIPLTAIYYYDESRRLYKKYRTHHTITIKQYEALEKQRSDAAKSLAKFTIWLIASSFIAVPIIIYCLS